MVVFPFDNVEFYWSILMCHGRLSHHAVSIQCGSAGTHKLETLRLVIPSLFIWQPEQRQEEVHTELHLQQVDFGSQGRKPRTTLREFLSTMNSRLTDHRITPMVGNLAISAQPGRQQAEGRGSGGQQAEGAQWQGWAWFS